MRLFQRLRGHVADAILVLLAAVLSVVVIVDRGRIGTREADERKYQLLDAWRGGDVTRVHVRHGGGEIELTRESRADDWHLVAGGREVQADEQAVGQYLVSLEFASFERAIDDLPDADMGLDSPFLALELEMGEIEYRLRLGKEAPTPPGARYAEVVGGARGRRRYVVGRELVESLAIDPGELRAKNLVPYFASQLASLALEGPEHRWKLERGGWGGRTAGAFLLERAGASKVRASRRQLEALLVALGRLEVERFVELPDEPAEGSHTLVMTPLDRAAEPGRLELGGACEGGTLVVRRTPMPAAGCAPAHAVKAVLLDAERLVDRHVLGAAEGDLMELALRGEAEVDVARREQGWHMRKPTDGAVEEPAMRALLDGLVAAEGTLVEEPGDLADLGLSPPRARIRVVALPERGGDVGSKDRIEEIDVGVPRDGWVHVRRHDDGAVLRLGEDAAAPLVPRPALLRATSVYDVPLERFASLSLDCAGKKQRMKREETGSWSLEPDTKGLGADMTLANQLAGLLGKLEAQRWVAEEPTERFSLDEPWCTIEAEVRGSPDGEEEPRTLSLRLGGETQGGYFAQAGKGRAVLVAPRNIGEQASRWLLDRGALILDPADIERVTLEVAARPSLVLLRQAGRWVAERDPTSRAGAAAGNALRELMAEQVVSLGAPREEQGFSAPQLIARIELESGKRLELKVGAGDALGGISVYYVRRSDIDATFAVPRSRVEPLLAAP